MLEYISGFDVIGDLFDLLQQLLRDEIRDALHDNPNYDTLMNDGI